MSAYWIAYLSDGQVVKQKDLESIDKTRTGWLQLKEYLFYHPKLDIRMIQLVVNGRVYNTPSLSPRATNDGKPNRLWCYQRYDKIIAGGSEDEHFFSISYRLGDFRHYTWVNTLTNESHIEICSVDNPREKVIEDFYDSRC